MDPASIQRDFISLLTIARAVVAGLLPGQQVVEHRATLRKPPVGYIGQGLRRGLGRQFREWLAPSGQVEHLLEIQDIAGLFVVVELTPAEQAQQQTAAAQELAAAPYQLAIGTRRFPAGDVAQAVNWATFLIGYLPLFPQGFIFEADFLSRDYAAISRQMERDQICTLNGVKGVAYLLPGQEGGSHAD